MTSMLPMPAGILEPHEFFEKRGRFQINFPEVNTSVSEYYFHLEIAAPGYEKDDFEIEVNNLELKVYVKDELVQEEDDDRVYHKKEFAKAPFKRTFRLPSNTSISKIEAKYRNGILYIDIPKVVKKNIETKIVAVE